MSLLSPESALEASKFVPKTTLVEVVLGKSRLTNTSPSLQLQYSLRWSRVFHMAGMYCLDDLIKLAASEGAEELHLSAGQPPVMVSRSWKRVLDLQPLTSDNVGELFRSFATEQQVEELGRCGEIHFNHSFQNSSRFGVTASVQGENISLRMKNLSR